MAVDRPSVKLLSFLRKHYGLVNNIPQVSLLSHWLLSLNAWTHMFSDWFLLLFFCPIVIWPPPALSASSAFLLAVASEPPALWLAVVSELPRAFRFALACEPPVFRLCSDGFLSRLSDLCIEFLVLNHLPSDGLVQLTGLLCDWFVSQTRLFWLVNGAKHLLSNRSSHPGWKGHLLEIRTLFLMNLLPVEILKCWNVLGHSLEFANIPEFNIIFANVLPIRV